MRKLTLLLLLGVITLQAPPGYSFPLGHEGNGTAIGREGNGGDVVEEFFIEKGTKLLAKLSRTPEGQKFLQSLPVSLTDLQATLDFKRISVSNAKLLDNTNSEVDALVKDGNIVLSKQIWLNYKTFRYDVQDVVFHEMLRSAGVKDDNYKYSSDISSYSELIDPRETLSLSSYINPNEISLKAVHDDFKTLIPTENSVSDLYMSVVITPTQGTARTLMRANKSRDFFVNIPVYNRGKTRTLVYRIDYVYEGILEPGAILKSDRGVRFQSSMWIERSDQKNGDVDRTQITLVDLLNIQTSYQESLRIQIKNKFQTQKSDSRSFMELKKIVVYFNVLNI